MINPYLCELCRRDGKTETAWFRVNFSPDPDPVEPLHLCEHCFTEYPPIEYSSIENLHITLSIEGGCCG